MASLHLLEEIFGWLLAASWQASAIALVVLAIQAIAGSRLNPRWASTRTLFSAPPS
jgi:hypothetical protein